MRVLIAGLGAIGQRHARNLRALRDDVELLALRRRHLRHVVTDSLTLDDSRDVEQALGVTTFDDLDAALAARPDAVFVCTPSSQHLGIAQRAAAAGCHLFIEKPVSHTMDGLDELQRTVRERRLVAMVGCQWRFHPCVIRLRQLLASGLIDPVHSAEIEYAGYLPDWHPYEDYRQSYAARAELGGGVVLTQIHDYDLAWWLFGAPRAVSASGGRESALEIDVEDTVRAELTTPAGSVFVSQTFASKSSARRIVVHGSVGTVTVDLIAASLDLDASLGPGLRMDNYPRNAMFRDEVMHFLECVDHGMELNSPLSDGVAVLRVALAVKESMRSGTRVELS